METKYFKNEHGAVWQLSDGRVMFRSEILKTYCRATLSNFEGWVAYLKN